MPAACAAFVTQPVDSSAVRNRRCLAGVQCARACADGGGSGDVVIQEDRSEEILHWKGFCWGGVVGIGVSGAGRGVDGEMAAYGIQTSKVDIWLFAAS